MRESSTAFCAQPLGLKGDKMLKLLLISTMLTASAGDRWVHTSSAAADFNNTDFKKSAAHSTALHRGEWTQGGHEKAYGSKFKNFKKSFMFNFPSSQLKAALLAFHNPNQHDIFEFGVYTGNSLRKLTHYLPEAGFHHAWGFDSFEGLPREAHNVIVEGLHWKPGAFSAADALGTWDKHLLMEAILKTIDHPNVTLVQGFFSESLPRMHLSKLRPAMFVHIDCDLYISAKDALSWLFRTNLMRPGTVISYNDWHQLKPGEQTWGEMKAHAEITREFGVRWRPLHQPSFNEFVVESIGDAAAVSEQYSMPTQHEHFSSSR